VKHALEVRKSLACGNYARFFKLYLSAPNMGTYLMEIFIEKHRILCLQKLCFANQNSNLDIVRLTTVLGFESQEDLLKLLETIGCTLLEDKKILDCRGSLAKLKAAPLKVKRCEK
jgi:hypothetical protein